MRKWQKNKIDFDYYMVINNLNNVENMDLKVVQIIYKQTNFWFKYKTLNIFYRLASFFLKFNRSRIIIVMIRDHRIYSVM